MATLGAVAIALAVTTGAGERLLLCRPRVSGDPAAARADAVAAAARSLGAPYLDYGVSCEGPPEAARAARRAGLRLAVDSAAEGTRESSRYVLTLADAAQEAALETRIVEVPSGADPSKALALALRELVPAEQKAGRSKGAGPWIVGGAGAVGLALGTGFALAARSAASDRDGASGPEGYVRADARWRSWRAASGLALAIGGAALAAGLVWQLAL